jgi:hypothetical protein
MKHYSVLVLLHERRQSSVISRNARALSGLSILPALAEQSRSSMLDLSKELKRAMAQYRGLRCQQGVRPLRWLGSNIWRKRFLGLEHNTSWKCLARHSFLSPTQILKIFSLVRQIHARKARPSSTRFLEADNISDPAQIFDSLVPSISSSSSVIIGGGTIASDEHRDLLADRAGKDERPNLDGPQSRIRPAWRTIPPVPGLHYDLDRLRIPVERGAALLDSIEENGYFRDGSNQVMLFGRASSQSGGLPLFLNDLLEELAGILRPHIPPATYNLLFPSGSDQSRQAILNRYKPGQGITPHVDLLKRFGDGIIGVSLGAGCVMDFKEVDGDAQWSIWLPPLSVIMLEGDARYRWTHGIGHVQKDWVSKGGSSDEGEWIQRGLRTSITLRWLLPGADIVGGMDSA